jgi:hypothetical protein
LSEGNRVERWASSRSNTEMISHTRNSENELKENIERLNTSEKMQQVMLTQHEDEYKKRDVSSISQASTNIGGKQIDIDEVKIFK